MFATRRPDRYVNLVLSPTEVRDIVRFMAEERYSDGFYDDLYHDLLPLVECDECDSTCTCF